MLLFVVNEDAYKSISKYEKYQMKM